MSQTDGRTTLANLFLTNTLRVPSFQRAYAWEPEPHLRDFLNDLRDHPAIAEKKYFFGTILLAEAKETSTPLVRGVDIVDGQQRLTTTCVFVVTALEKLRDEERHKQSIGDWTETFIRKSGGRRKFKTIEEDDVFFERFILGDEGAQQQDYDTPSKHRLLKAKIYFREKLANLSADEVVRLLNVLCKSHILLYTVDTNAEATQIFELQNDRGKRLSDLEALKSFLMHKIYLHAGENTENDLNFIRQNFAAIYRASEQIENMLDPLGEDQILAYHCIAFEHHLTLGDDATKGWRKPKLLIRKILEDAAEMNWRNGMGHVEWIKAFSSRLKDSFTYVLSILNARSRIDSLGDLAALGRMATFWPLLIKCWKFDLSDKKSDFSSVVREMEKFAFRSEVSGKRSDTGGPTLIALVSKFSGDFVDLKNRIAEMRAEWDISRLYPLNLHSEDFYHWGGAATYLLWRYENHLRIQPGQQYPRLSWETIASPVNTAVRYAKDHIEPQDEANTTLTEQVKWDDNDEQEQFRQFREVFLHRLGNLVLDTTSAGAARANNNFADRIAHYQNSGFLSHGEIVSTFASDVDGKKVWDTNAIRKRHNALVEFAIGSI